MGVGVFRNRLIFIVLLVLTPVAAEAYDPVEAGGKKAVQCAPCHRLNGVSEYPGIPHLAGQKRDVLLDQIRDFLDKKHPRPRSGSASRSEGVMEHTVDGLSNRDIFDLASYFSSLPCPLPAKRNSAPVPEVIIRCARCHGDTGRNTYKNVPNLAGQSKQYLENQLRALRESGLVPNDPLIVRHRSHPMMGPQALFLSEAEIRNLADYFSTRMCR